MDYFGYFLAAIIGMSLALLGAGGSILTVPLLVYIFKIEATQAVRYSLFIVGITSSFSVLPRFKKEEVMVYQGSIFATVSLVTVIMVRNLVIPKVTLQIFFICGFSIGYAELSMILFAILMLLASRMMLRENQCWQKSVNRRGNQNILIASALFTGLITGLLGAGGGFIIVPALVLLFGSEIKQAIGTSLFIIAINSIAGFLSELGNNDINWLFILKITGVALAGTYIGYKITPFVNSKKLKIYFGWFITLMAITILALQVIKLNHPA